jgi:hypothetical protein
MSDQRQTEGKGGEAYVESKIAIVGEKEWNDWGEVRGGDRWDR